MFVRDDAISERMKKQLKRYLAQEVPMDVRPVEPEKYARLKEGVEPKILVWMKAKGHVGEYITNIV